MSRVFASAAQKGWRRQSAMTAVGRSGVQIGEEFDGYTFGSGD